MDTGMTRSRAPRTAGDYPFGLPGIPALCYARDAQITSHYLHRLTLECDIFRTIRKAIAKSRLRGRADLETIA